MEKDGLNQRSPNNLHNWLITLSLFFISFFGVILALTCIFALPDKTVRPLEGSTFFISGSVIVIALICIYALPDNSVQPKIGLSYFLGSAIVMGSFIIVVWKNWIYKKA